MIEQGKSSELGGLASSGMLAEEKGNF